MRRRAQATEPAYILHTKSHVEAVKRLLYGDEEHRPSDVRHVLALPPYGRRDHGDHEDLAQVDRVEHLEGEREGGKEHKKRRKIEHEKTETTTNKNTTTLNQRNTKQRRRFKTKRAVKRTHK